MKRRNFIIAGAAGIAAVSIPSAWYFISGTVYNKVIAIPGSLLLIMDAPSIALIGQQYLAQLPGENSERKLVKRIMDGVEEQQDTLNRELEAKIATEFKAGNTVIVDGWILSVTEARQCALLSIDQLNE